MLQLMLPTSLMGLEPMRGIAHPADHRRRDRRHFLEEMAPTISYNLQLYITSLHFCHVVVAIPATWAATMAPRLLDCKNLSWRPSSCTRVTTKSMNPASLGK